MPPHTRITEFGPTSNQLAGQGNDPEIGALVAHAAWSVEALHYLVDLDAHLFSTSPPGLLGHGDQIADIAHARWSAGTAITAIDLCAAALGRLRCGAARRNRHEYDLRELCVATLATSPLPGSPRQTEWSAIQTTL
jgi:hypothetical protein